MLNCTGKCPFEGGKSEVAQHAEREAAPAAPSQGQREKCGRGLFPPKWHRCVWRQLMSEQCQEPYPWLPTVGGKSRAHGGFTSSTQAPGGALGMLAHSLAPQQAHILLLPSTVLVVGQLFSAFLALFLSFPLFFVCPSLLHHLSD